MAVSPIKYCFCPPAILLNFALLSGRLDGQVRLSHASKLIRMILDV